MARQLEGFLRGFLGSLNENKKARAEQEQRKQEQQFVLQQIRERLKAQKELAGHNFGLQQGQIAPQGFDALSEPSASDFGPAPAPQVESPQADFMAQKAKATSRDMTKPLSQVTQADAAKVQVPETPTVLDDIQGSINASENNLTELGKQFQIADEEARKAPGNPRKQATAKSIEAQMKTAKSNIATLQRKQIGEKTRLLESNSRMKSDISKLGGDISGLNLQGKSLPDKNKVLEDALFTAQSKQFGFEAREKAAKNKQTPTQEARQRFSEVAASFKGIIAFAKGKKIEQGQLGIIGGIKGEIGKFLANLLDKPEFTRTGAYPGQLTEVALKLNNVLTGQKRVIKGVVKMIEKTLPGRFESGGGVKQKVAQTIRNAFLITKAIENTQNKQERDEFLDVLDGLEAKEMLSLIDAIRLTPEEEAEFTEITQDLFATPPAPTFGDLSVPQQQQQQQQQQGSVLRQLPETAQQPSATNEGELTTTSGIKFKFRRKS